MCALSISAGIGLKTISKIQTKRVKSVSMFTIVEY